MQILCIDPSGCATLKGRREDPFADGEEREVTISEYGPEDFPLEANMQLNSIDVADGQVRIVLNSTSEEIGEGRTTEEDGFWTQVEEQLGITKLGDQVELNENQTGAANYRGFIEFLYDEGYLRRDDLPVHLPNARSRFLINSAPEHMNGGDMAHPQEIADGIVAEMNFSTSNIERNILFLGEELGN